MDPMKEYRAIVKDVVLLYASYKPAYGDIETEAVMDDERGHYEVVRVGWRGDERVHGSVIHLDLVEDKVWVQHDGTNWPVAEELERRGIPRDRIVLGFHPPHVRAMTNYAVG
jgi:hypothetical protein